MSAFEIATDLYYMALDGEDGTVNVADSGVLPTEGYYVGGKAPSLVFKGVDEIDRGELAWWVGSNPSDYYGVWVDTEDGKIYFDAVTHMLYQGTALDLARIRNEIAVWDIANGAEVRLAD